MPVEPGVVDANVFAYAVNADVPQHAASRGLLEEARDPSASLYITSQILCEFYSVITNPRRVAAPLASGEARQILSAMLALPGLHVLASPASAMTELMELLRRHPVTGADVFDLQIVAAMKAHEVQRIYTFNTRDFEVFSELIVVVPGT